MTTSGNWIRRGILDGGEEEVEGLWVGGSTFATFTTVDEVVEVVAGSAYRGGGEGDLFTTLALPLPSLLSPSTLVVAVEAAAMASSACLLPLVRILLLLISISLVFYADNSGNLKLGEPSKKHR